MAKEKKQSEQTKSAQSGGFISDTNICGVGYDLENKWYLVEFFTLLFANYRFKNKDIQQHMEVLDESKAISVNTKHREIFFYFVWSIDKLMNILY